MCILSPEPIPKPSFLDCCDCLGFISGAKRWRSKDGQKYFTWDSMHGEIEVFNKRGKHIAVFHPLTGKTIKYAVKGRVIDV